MLQRDVARRFVVYRGVHLNDREPAVILAGLFELTITYAEDDEKRTECKALAAKLGGNPNEMFFGAQGGR
jgi:hypothetical protein